MRRERDRALAGAARTRCPAHAVRRCGSSRGRAGIHRAHSRRRAGVVNRSRHRRAARQPAGALEHPHAAAASAAMRQGVNPPSAHRPLVGPAAAQIVHHARGRTAPDTARRRRRPRDRWGARCSGRARASPGQMRARHDDGLLGIRPLPVRDRVVAVDGAAAWLRAPRWRWRRRRQISGRGAGCVRTRAAACGTRRPTPCARATASAPASASSQKRSPLGIASAHLRHHRHRDRVRLGERVGHARRFAGARRPVSASRPTASSSGSCQRVERQRLRAGSAALRGSSRQSASASPSRANRLIPRDLEHAGHARDLHFQLALATSERPSGQPLAVDAARRQRPQQPLQRLAHVEQHRSRRIRRGSCTATDEAERHVLAADHVELGGQRRARRDRRAGAR